MKSIFLKLSSFRFGAARRLCPFTSIIHKHISILSVLVFVFSILFSYVYPVAALADPQPEYDPVYNTEIIRLVDYVDDELSPDQQDIFYTMFGAYLVAQGAMEDQFLEDPYTTQDGILGWFKSCGIQIYNSAIVQNALMSPSLLVSQGIQDLVDYAMGLAMKVGIIEDKVTWIDDVMSSEHYFLPYNKSIQFGLNQVLANNGGLYNWSISTDYFITPGDWIFSVMSQSNEERYLSFLSSYPVNLRYNDTPDLYYKNARVSFDQFSTYHNLFINISNHTFDICDDNGNLHGGSFYGGKRIVYHSPDLYINNLSFWNYPYGSYDSSIYTSPVALARAFFNNELNGNMAGYRFYSDIIDHVYAGTNWNSKVEIFNTTDLNFSNELTNYYLQVQNDYLLDLKGLIQDLIDVIVLKPVLFDNIYDPSGNQVDPVTNQVSVTVSLPDSGIIVPSGIFGSSKGFIDYLWYMTKPLVQYTHDFLGTMWFDGVEGFDFSGPAPIVFGVITLGLIGGLIVKFLL